MEIITKPETETLFSNGINRIPVSFIREILKVTADPEMISFAGGLPNPALFPVEEIKNATIEILQKEGGNILQYAETEGFYPLREYIASRYQKRFNLEISPEEILITNGSQQALDLIGKVFLNPGDRVLLEKPSYLGAIQSFSFYQPEFLTIPMENDGPDMEKLNESLSLNCPKFFYCIPNFQNPSGITYSDSKRKRISETVIKNNLLLVEDDPYGEINFSGENLPPLKSQVGNRGILLGTFSKIVAPGLRLGWVVAEKSIIRQLVRAKQASDLHSNNLSQRVIYQYLLQHDLEDHLNKLRFNYEAQCTWMLSAIKKYFPKQISYTEPKGGMFIWGKLPKGYSAMDLANETIKEKVVFVPGNTFFVDGDGENTFRLNFSNTDKATIEKGIKIMGAILDRFLEGD
ncbi:PLP-dependent aminotransferase family protein [Flexithrix dorotheae]|uniref:aminotransferase-like domain-containing protein n=1 Tax=Flexithrix dorotheae TaxID=70993 RepID=UPI0003658A58|nr:PLP-dependent aminotransferase family protein [Flexithrix dorotheae]